MSEVCAGAFFKRGRKKKSGRQIYSLRRAAISKKGDGAEDEENEEVRGEGGDERKSRGEELREGKERAAKGMTGDVCVCSPLQTTCY